MKHWHLAAATAAFSFIAAPAMAQDFTGPRVELRVGLDNNGGDVEFDGELGSGEDDEDQIGLTYGGEVGYDLQLGGLVVGGYAGIEGSNLETCEEVFGNDEGCIGQGRNIYVGGRAGVTLGERFLVYGKGGYSNGSVDVTYEGPGGFLDDFEINEDFDGYHLGAGVEFAITNFIYGRAEYVHTEYEDLEAEDQGTASLSRDNLVLGIGLRF